MANRRLKDRDQFYSGVWSLD